MHSYENSECTENSTENNHNTDEYSGFDYSPYIDGEFNSIEGNYSSIDNGYDFSAFE